MRRWTFALIGVLACGVSERGDFLVGRACGASPPTGCDVGQVCLPHAYDDGRPDDFRCRDASSFSSSPGMEAPLAFCAPEEGFVCPDGLVCNAGRIRVDVGPRRRVCKSPEDTFGPPLDAGAKRDAP